MPQDTNERLPEAHARSLIRAGIGSLYHNQSLTDYGNLGRGYAELVKRDGAQIAGEGQACVFVGDDQRQELIMLARAFHLNGAGVRVRTITQLLADLTKDEAREEIEDAAVLFLMPAQTMGRDAPMRWGTADMLEGYLTTRIEAQRCVFLNWDVNTPHFEQVTANAWWSDGFVQFLRRAARIVRRSDVLQSGADAARADKALIEDEAKA